MWSSSLDFAIDGLVIIWGCLCCEEKHETGRWDHYVWLRKKDKTVPLFLLLLLGDCTVFLSGEIKVKYMMSITCFQLCFALLGPAPTGTGTITLDPTFGSFTLLESISHLSKLVSLVKMFRLFRLEWIFFGVWSVNRVSRCTTSYLLAGPACLWCLVLFAFLAPVSCLVLSCHVTKLFSHVTKLFSHDTYAHSHQICWNVSFISLWEMSVYIIIYHLSKSLKRGQKVKWKPMPKPSHRRQNGRFW
jgi:hypothetical protein